MTEDFQNNDPFKMRPESDIEEASISKEVDELKIEKINQRVTLISIMIPVLIVIVLVFAYMDIKQRVVRTEDTGTIGVQKLSKDLESRFSSLSLRQAKLEDAVAKLTDDNNQALAGIQVKLKKVGDSLSRLQRNTVAKKDLKSTLKDIKDLRKQLNNVAASVEDANNKTATMSAALEAQMAQQVTQMDEAVLANKDQAARLETNLLKLEQNKIDKEALNLALKLEMLKMEQTLKVRFESIQNQLKKLERNLTKTKPPAKPASSAAKPVSSTAKPPPAKTQPAPSKPATTSPPPPAPKIEEQTIK